VEGEEPRPQNVGFFPHPHFGPLCDGRLNLRYLHQPGVDRVNQPMVYCVHGKRTSARRSPGGEMTRPVEIKVELTTAEALAYAQFVKRAGWRDYRANAGE
jgi:hypothetical protein